MTWMLKKLKFSLKYEYEIKGRHGKGKMYACIFKQEHFCPFMRGLDSLFTLLNGQTGNESALVVVNYLMITYIHQRRILYATPFLPPPPLHYIIKKKKQQHWHTHHAHIHTQLAAQVLDSCHALPDFWLGLLRVSCHPAEFYRGVRPVWRALCEGWGGLGYCSVSLLVERLL